MAARANVDLVRAIPKEFFVAAGGSTTAGMPVKFGATDQEITVATAADAAVVFATASVTAAAGERVEVVPHGFQMVPIKVGVGGATRGKKLKLVNTGYTDTTDAADIIHGRAMQSGVVGDIIGMLVGGAA
jgi:hypothetical protein